MANDLDRDYGEQDPHFDGVREGIINDSEGKRIGIRAETSEDQNNPYHVKLKNNPLFKK